MSVKGQYKRKQSKNDLQDFLRELRDPIEELKRPCETPEQLQKNLQLKKEVMETRTALQARILPIKQKFQYLQGDENSEFCNLELTEEEKEQLASLDEAWNRFTAGLVEAT